MTWLLIPYSIGVIAWIVHVACFKGAAIRSIKKQFEGEHGISPAATNIIICVTTIAAAFLWPMFVLRSLCAVFLLLPVLIAKVTVGNVPVERAASEESVRSDLADIGPAVKWLMLAIVALAAVGYWWTQL